MTQITIELENHIADKLKNLVKFFGDKDLLFDNFIEFHKKKLKREIARMQGDLENFEQKYQMSSAIFYEKFEGGKLEDSKDFVLWSGIYEMLLDSKEKLQQLS